MSRHDDFLRRVESEAEADGPEAVAELNAFREYYRIAHLLATRRRELQWTQAYLSSLAGVHQSEISRIESARGNPTILTLSRLSSALGVALCPQTVCEERPTRHERPSLTRVKV